MGPRATVAGDSFGAILCRRKAANNVIEEEEKKLALFMKRIIDFQQMDKI